VDSPRRAELTLVRFGRLLRARGLPVGTGRILTFCRAAAVLAPLDRDRLYWAGRATLISRPEHVDDFDRSFNETFGRGGIDETLAKLFEFSEKTRVPELEVEADEGATAQMWELADASDLGEEDVTVSMIAGSADVLRERSFEDLDESERARVFVLIRRLAMGMPMRRARRTLPATRGGRFDLRRTVRHSLRTHGEPFRRAYRDRGWRPRPLVLILDVSGSMSPYARALMQFGFAAMNAGRRVEVFCFGTRLTRVTRSLMAKNPDDAMRSVAEVVVDWSGGTRIGESLRVLLDRYGATVFLRGAVTVVCSDGLDRGEPELLAAQMTRLARLSHRIVWVNPLKGDPRYEPLARGMAAALPHVDVFIPGHNLASLEALVQVVSR
jgi:uncharacterized protein with von Willebrand factor type A (vWA) domain